MAGLLGIESALILRGTGNKGSPWLVEFVVPASETLETLTSSDAQVQVGDQVVTRTTYTQTVHLIDDNAETFSLGLGDSLIDFTNDGAGTSLAKSLANPKFL